MPNPIKLILKDSFTDSYKDSLINYWTRIFKVDRATRTEFWFPVYIYNIIIPIILSIWDLSAIVLTLTIIPFISVSIRRLHDSNFSGWNLLFWFVPIIGWYIISSKLITDGSLKSNNYGIERI